MKGKDTKMIGGGGVDLFVVLIVYFDRGQINGEKSSGIEDVANLVMATKKKKKRNQGEKSKGEKVKIVKRFLGGGEIGGLGNGVVGSVGHKNC